MNETQYDLLSIRTLITTSLSRGVGSGLARLRQFKGESVGFHKAINVRIRFIHMFPIFPQTHLLTHSTNTYNRSHQAIMTNNNIHVGISL